MSYTRVLVMTFVVVSAMCSCSTMKVVSNMYSVGAEVFEAQDVVVYEKGIGVPDSAIKVGEFATYDDGRAKTEPYETTLERVKEEAGANGANVVNILEHELPYMSSNHQFSGEYLLATDMTVTEGNTHVRRYEDYLAAQAEAESRKLKGGSLQAGLGYGYITSQMEFASGIKIDGGRVHHGVTYDVRYDFVNRRGISFGIIGSGFRSSAPATIEGSSGIFGLNLGVLAPTIGYSSSTDRFAYNAIFGCGYGSCKESFSIGSGSSNANVGGLGLVTGVEILYRINDSNAFGFNLNDLAIGMKDQQVAGAVEWYSFQVSFRRSF